MKFKHYITVLLLMLAINFTPNIVNAQDSPTDTTGLGDPDGGPTNVPFDGGISILVAAGVAYGIKKRREYSSKQSSEE